MFLFTTAFDPRYRLEFSPANLKQSVVRLLKSHVKNHSCRETGQSGQVSLVPPNKPKTQLPKNDVPKTFSSFYSIFKSERGANTHESEQKVSVNQQIETEVKVFF